MRYKIARWLLNGWLKEKPVRAVPLALELIDFVNEHFDEDMAEVLKEKWESISDNKKDNHE